MDSFPGSAWECIPHQVASLVSVRGIYMHSQRGRWEREDSDMIWGLCPLSSMQIMPES